MLSLVGLKRCRYCQSIINIKYIECPVCGNPVKDFRLNGKRADVYKYDGEYFLTVSLREYYGYKKKKKWVTFFLCLLFGVFGFHKAYEEKYLLAVLYLFTCGLCGFGYFFDLIAILLKEETYYVKK